MQRAREARGLSLDELTRTTKIGKATLIALESGDVLRLPAAIYTRGFIKAYAKEVGLDPEATADEYFTRIEPQTTHHLLVDDGMLPPLAHIDAGVNANDDTRQLLAVNQVRRFGRVTTLAAAVGLVVYVVSFNRHASDEQALPAQEQPAQNDAVKATSIAAAHEAQAIGVRTDGVSMTINGPLTVELLSQGPCWLVATVDGERVVARLLQPGERHTLEVGHEALLRVGDPGALSISINGHSGRVLGPPGQPVNVKITKDNFKEFLSS